MPLTPDNALRSPFFKTLCFINSAWVADLSGASMAIHNPYDGKLVASAPILSSAMVNQAIEAAAHAFTSYRALTGKERGVLLRKWSDIIIAHADELAAIMTLEQGKPLAEAKGEILYAASYIEWFSGEARRVYGDTIPANRPDHRIVVQKEPIGVAAAITPWNFPFSMIARKAGAALAAGCTIVIKPDSRTPFSAFALAACAEQAGIPAGVLNVVTGDAATIGKQLCEHPAIRKLSFTGSTRVGKLLASQSGHHIIKLSLELGGNAPFILFPSANIDQAVPAVIASRFRNAGQTCVCTNRVLVHRSIEKAFIEKLSKEVAKLTLGSGFDPSIQLGPVIDDTAVARLSALKEDAKKKGATLIEPHNTTVGDPSKRHVKPCIIQNASSPMRVVSEEIFGPLLPVMTFDSFEEAVQKANDTSYGLAAYAYTNDLNESIRISEALQYGMVGINESLISTEVAPFGGVKDSGFGREGSRYGIDEYLQLKYICTHIL